MIHFFYDLSILFPKFETPFLLRNHNIKEKEKENRKRTMPGKWQILNGVKYPVEDSEATTTKHIVTNPFFQDGKEWEVIKELTPEDIMKILKKQQKENKKKEKEGQVEGKKQEQKGKQRSLGFSRQNGAGKHWIPE